jgi:hypothetical protein
VSSSYLYFYGREIVEEMRRKCVRRRREGLQINRPEKRDENLLCRKVKQLRNRGSSVE